MMVNQSWLWLSGILMTGLGLRAQPGLPLLAIFNRTGPYEYEARTHCSLHLPSAAALPLQLHQAQSLGLVSNWVETEKHAGEEKFGAGPGLSLQYVSLQHQEQLPG